ncbi:hypothetical protein [Mycobacterium sp. 852002-51057_SCH5723018]|uniref:hypothetical protein n=1 Tax=Mycobacterium sp. 852002-51057_SCH5723018 TaxID=1834094 RepID=UPI0007FE3AC1|nr:hypothetical protein [Mycobacterium sp. 852002-51057_SCH5723018]OBG23439.1 hypothetical protein A5764_10815 [Mycobacterium sp. 852002-51057_SCH5723018]
MTGSMTFTIPVPSPGEVAAHDLGDDLTVLIENTGVGSTTTGARAAIPTITYEAVDVRGGTRVHAAAVKHHPQRSVVSRWALCSITNSLRVIRRRRHDDLNAVTCTRCRRRLERAGLL